MPLPTPADFPLINGMHFDFSSIGIQLQGTRLPMTAYRSVNYSAEMTPGEVWGASAIMAGRTRGQLKANGSIEIYKSAVDDFIAAIFALAAKDSVFRALASGAFGYMEVPFLMIVSYSDFGIDTKLSGPVVDTLVACRVTKIEDSHNQGQEPLTSKVSLHMVGVVHNGRSPVGGLEAIIGMLR